jgi:5-(aminomethyl)-3-furanmethanol phosphate kinase
VQGLAGLLPAARVTTSPDEIARVLAEGLLPVLSPFCWLHAADPLPHGWQVTSDSIAAWVAARLSARRLVLLKSLPGVPGARGDVLTEAPLRSPALAGIVDEHFPQAVARRPSSRPATGPEHPAVNRRVVGSNPT